MDHPFINDPTPEQVAVLVQAGFDQPTARSFSRAGYATNVKPRVGKGIVRWQVVAGFENGKFGWYATCRRDNSEGMWRGPIFDDPLAAFVHAEVCEWRS